MLVGSGFTAIAFVWKQAPLVAVMTTEGDEATPHTTPPAVTVATAGLLLVHTTPGLEVKVMHEPTHTLLGPNTGIGTKPKRPKLVPPEPDVMPAMPVTDDAMISPMVELVRTGCTCRPVIVNMSCSKVPEVVVLMVSPELEIVNDTALISPPPEAVITGGGATQNCHPDGGLSTIWLAPKAKSLLSVSLIVMMPNVVHPGAVPLVAVCAQMPVSCAGVTTTWAKPE